MTTQSFCSVRSDSENIKYGFRLNVCRDTLPESFFGDKGEVFLNQNPIVLAALKSFPPNTQLLLHTSFLRLWGRNFLSAKRVRVPRYQNTPSLRTPSKPNRIISLLLRVYLSEYKRYMRRYGIESAFSLPFSAPRENQTFNVISLDVTTEYSELAVLYIVARSCETLA